MLFQRNRITASYRKIYLITGGSILFMCTFFFFKISNKSLIPKIFDPKSVIRNCVTEEIVAEFILNSDSKTFTDKIQQENIKYEADLTGEKRQQLFVETFNKDIWGGKQDKNYAGLQKSGGGSMLTFAQEMMASLHILISNFKRSKGVHVVRILDIPCGDLQWMNRFLESRNDVIYTGMDIVPDIIKHHNENFAHPNRTFILQDAVLLDMLPGKFDIVICRHMLQHLRTKDIMKVLTMFSNGDGEGNKPLYFVTSNHYLASSNAEISINAGVSRYVNLELPPYNFAPPMCIARECKKCVSFFHEHFVTIYKMPFITVNCLTGAVQNLWKETGHKLFSCSGFTNV